jgi:hypothetical protein
MKYSALFILAILIFMVTSMASPATLYRTRYVPKQGDHFSYYEVIVLNDGVGNYTGYTEATYINGTYTMSNVFTNGSVYVNYHTVWHYVNNSGGNTYGGITSSFYYSYNSFLYTKGTDNQTGYTTPRVWFYINNTLSNQSTFFILNTQMTVLSNRYPFEVENKYVYSIYTEGNGSYQRNDIYGIFTANYNWKSYYDPGTGYILGYVYTEQDYSNGNGFTLIDKLAITNSSYPLSPASAPPAQSNNANGSSSYVLGLFLAMVIIFIVVLIIIYIYLKSKKNKIPKHSNPSYPSTQVNSPTPPVYQPANTPTNPTNAAIPPVNNPANYGQSINLTPPSQPAVQQIVIKEVVKVRCEYCGALIDSTAKVCPYCNAPR